MQQMYEYDSFFLQFFHKLINLMHVSLQTSKYNVSNRTKSNYKIYW